jgi:hypothetical protein
VISFVLVVAVTAFLTGAVSATFLLLVIGIRRADQGRRRPPAQESPLSAVTRTTLRAGIWPTGPAFDEPEND